MRDWLSRLNYHNRRDRKRYNRLISKLQKAGAMGHKEEVIKLPSWGKRFRRTARLRVVKE